MFLTIYLFLIGYISLKKSGSICSKVCYEGWSITDQGGIKYFASWEPHLLGQCFAWDSMMRDSWASSGLISFTSSCHKKSFSARKDYCQQKEKISCNNKWSLASRNYFLPQNIIYCPKKFISCHKPLPLTLTLPSWYWLLIL